LLACLTEFCGFQIPKQEGKTKKSTAIAVGNNECVDNVTGLLLVTERCNLDILSVKKDAKLSASEMPGKEEGNGEEDFSVAVCLLFARGI